MGRDLRHGDREPGRHGPKVVPTNTISAIGPQILLYIGHDRSNSSEAPEIAVKRAENSRLTRSEHIDTRANQMREVLAPTPVASRNITHPKMVVELASSCTVESRGAARRVGHKVRWWLERLGAREALLVHASEVHVPGNVHRLRVLPPQSVHLLYVVRVRAICEGIVGRRRLRRSLRCKRAVCLGRRGGAAKRDTGKPLEGAHRAGEHVCGRAVVASTTSTEANGRGRVGGGCVERREDEWNYVESRARTRADPAGGASAERTARPTL